MYVLYTVLHVCIYIYIYIYIFFFRERKREKQVMKLTRIYSKDRFTNKLNVKYR